MYWKVEKYQVQKVAVHTEIIKSSCILNSQVDIENFIWETTFELFIWINIKPRKFCKRHNFLQNLHNVYWQCKYHWQICLHGKSSRWFFFAEKKFIVLGWLTRREKHIGYQKRWDYLVYFCVMNNVIFFFSQVLPLPDFRLELLIGMRGTSYF